MLSKSGVMLKAPKNRFRKPIQTNATPSFDKPTPAWLSFKRHCNAETCSSFAQTTLWAIASELIERWLAKFLTWDAARCEEQKRAFASVYSPVTILPPDQYLTLVLQVTLGCHWNRCTFCDFYRTVRFHIRSMEEFEQHIHGVKRFFGDGIRLRRSIFLGDANALILPQNRLVRVFDQINQEFCFADSPSGARRDGPIFEGINSFLDVFAGERRSEMDFRELKARHLKRVYLGMESGFDPLLAFLNKPANFSAGIGLGSQTQECRFSCGVDRSDRSRRRPILRRPCRGNSGSDSENASWN